MAFTHHTQCRDAALLNSVKYMSETKDTRRDHGPETNTLPSVTSSELSPVSSTIASMSRLKNIAVTKSAPYSLQLSSSIANKAANSLSSTSICPYMVCSSTNYSHDVPTNKSERNESNQNLRRGKWTPEEEEYANAVVREFNSGYLDAEAGTTLRIYLSEKLQCDPMRITKKFTGNDSIGKRVFHPTGRIGDGLTKDARNAQATLKHLHQKWKDRLDHQHHEYARKTMAAQAVSQASSLDKCGGIIHSSSSIFPPEFNHSEAAQQRNTEKNIRTTAMWLARATDITNTHVSGIQTNIENELRIITRLIDDAPAVVTIASDFLRQKRIDQPKTETSNGRKRKQYADTTNASDSLFNPMKLLASISSHATPVPVVDIIQDKCNHFSKPINSVSIGDLEDAQTFVHFLKSMT